MCVDYVCKKCGLEHPAIVGWDDKDRFDAVPADAIVGEYGCPFFVGEQDKLQIYRKKDLVWKGEFQGAQQSGL